MFGHYGLEVTYCLNREIECLLYSREIDNYSYEYEIQEYREVKIIVTEPEEQEPKEFSTLNHEEVMERLKLDIPFFK